MKRLLFTVMFLLVTASVAYAGWFGTVTGYIKAEAISVAIGVIIGGLGIFGVSYKLWGKAAKELGEFVWTIYQSVQTTSNGGKEITKKEMEKILKEGAEIFPAVQVAIASHKKKEIV